MTRNPIASGNWTALKPLLQEHGTVFLESQFRGTDNCSSYLLCNPVDILECKEPGMVTHCLSRIEEELNRGNYAAGFISYEAGLSLVPHQEPLPTHGFPLIWMGIYDRAWSTDAPIIMEEAPGGILDVHPELSIRRDEFTRSVQRIRQLIGQGDTYQVNFTGRLHFRYPGSPLNMYLGLRQSHPVPFGALMNCGSFSLVSQSPELFLKKEKNVLETRPMKGTASRGEDVQTDRKNEEGLRESPKDRAENLMIADLMRNDLGRIAEPGSVEIFDPFRIEKYRSVFQMTTGVRCRIPGDLGVGQILKATFPPGSVTGAPKVRTMQIISELERSPRKSYTGAMGIFFPKGDFVLSVAIRTIIVNRDGSCELGVGSGIVADSRPEKEYRETLLKSRFLGHGKSDPVSLMETILLSERGHLKYLSEHLGRMAGSAKALGYPFSSQGAGKALETHLGPLSEGPLIVRLLLDPKGDFQVQVRTLDDLNGSAVKRMRISAKTVDGSDVFLRHKTTRRSLYDGELSEARADGFVDVLFENTEGYITEGAFTNIFLLLPDGWKTPSVTCGLLPGIWREVFLLESCASEAMLTRDDLRRASRVFVGNSVRGAVEVHEVLDPAGDVVFKRTSDHV